jgi:hypothetical protein
LVRDDASSLKTEDDNVLLARTVTNSGVWDNDGMIINRGKPKKIEDKTDQCHSVLYENHMT